jgi:cell wall-associated NlpC family hydrolase
MNLSDERYVGVPWKDGGRNFVGADCVGLTCLFLEQEFGFSAPVPSSGHRSEDLKTALEKVQYRFKEDRLMRGDVIFFAHANGEIRHVAVWLGGGRLLHTFKGGPSRIENGFRLARRVGMTPVAAVDYHDAEFLARALANKKLADPATIGVLIVAVILSIASSFIMAALQRKGNSYGKYGFDGLITQNSPEIPLPDILGNVTVAGNSPYTQLKDKNLVVSSQAQQAANKIVVLCSGPITNVDYLNFNLTVNAISYNDPSFYSGSQSNGIIINPLQTEAAAVMGTIGSDNFVPSMTIYDGHHDITVPVDIRAQFDRTFPIYGYSDCSYIVFRLFNSTVFSSFNLNARIQGRLCRQYTAAGFTSATSAGEVLAAGDGTATRFKFSNFDVGAVSSVSVNGTGYAALAPGSQTGNVYWLNATKGYIEFIAAPAAAAVITVSYTYYPRVWTQCPADHLVYLLTEKGRGKGFDSSRIDWPRAVAFQTYCNAPVMWNDSAGVTQNPRYTTNYSIDFRKPIQEHMQAICDACCAYLFISQGKFVMKARAQDTSIFSFNSNNILLDSFSSQMLERTNLPNSIKLFFHDQNTYNSETEVDRDDQVDQALRAPRVGNGGAVEQVLKYTAIDNQQQSERVADILLSESLNVAWTINFKTTVLGLALEPGDVIDVTHSSQPAWNQKLFRIEDLQYGDDDRLEIQATEYFDGAYI